MGHDFWVVNRCVSNYVDGRVMEGTRLIFEVVTVDLMQSSSDLVVQMFTLSWSLCVLVGTWQKRDPRGIKYGIQIGTL